MDKNNKKTEVFLSLLMANQRRINSYILSLVPVFNDADDIMQETISVMWSKFDQFEVGTDFTWWGIKVAYYHIMSYRKQKATDKLVFSDGLLEKINAVAKEKQVDTDDRIKHLRQCIEKLNPVDQRLLKARYELNYNADNLAIQLDRSVQYVYKHLSRILHSLNLCVRRVFHEAEVL